MDTVLNASNIQQAMEAWGVSWTESPSNRASKALRISGEIGGQTRLTSSTRDVVFVYDSNNIKIESERLSDVGLPEYYEAQWQEFVFDKQSKTLTITGRIHNRSYVIKIEA